MDTNIQNGTQWRPSSHQYYYHYWYGQPNSILPNCSRPWQPWEAPQGRRHLSPFPEIRAGEPPGKAVESYTKVGIQRQELLLVPPLLLPSPALEHPLEHYAGNWWTHHLPVCGAPSGLHEVGVTMASPQYPR